MALVFDSFDRANETPLAAPWATGSGDPAGFNITSNVAAPTSLASDACSVYNGAGSPTWADNQGASVKVTMAGTNAGSGWGVCLRHAPAARTQYRIILNKLGSNNVEIGRFAPGFTSLTTLTTAWVDGDLLAAEVTGPAAAAVIRVFRNGVDIGGFTDNSTLLSGAPGISHSSTTTSGSLNDWTGYDIGGSVARTFNPIPLMR